jgi:cysteine synthase A
MGKIYQGIEELVGHTPLVNFRRLAKAEGVNAEILAKLECFNPAGSAKDRVGLQMVLDAEKAGILKRGSVIIEPTSGTGCRSCRQGLQNGDCHAGQYE